MSAAGNPYARKHDATAAAAAGKHPAGSTVVIATISEEMARALVARLDRLGATGASIAPRGAITVSVRLQARWNDAGAADAAAIAGRYDAQARDCN